MNCIHRDYSPRSTLPPICAYLYSLKETECPVEIEYIPGSLRLTVAHFKNIIRHILPSSKEHTCSALHHMQLNNSKTHKRCN
ncbi:hypothetical protein VTO42DRAFT_296 [Malbranchea cinnamomea]